MGDRDVESTPVVLDYAVLGGASRCVSLARGDSWTFGRSERCSESLALSSLSRLAVVLEHTDRGLVRVSSRQSGMGRVRVSSDDARQEHSIGLGALPVVLAGGNYSLKVELPPVVLRMQLAVPSPGASQGSPASRSSPKRRTDVTSFSWTPLSQPEGGCDWIDVIALAVALARYPELSRTPASDTPLRMSEALRRAVGLWCGHTSQYWVNERLKEAITAADLVVPERGERLALTVSHYGPIFADSTIRELRDKLLGLLGEPGAGAIPAS